jgi:hypothetical protein
MKHGNSIIDKYDISVTKSHFADIFPRSARSLSERWKKINFARSLYIIVARAAFNYENAVIFQLARPAYLPLFALATHMATVYAR